MKKHITITLPLILFAATAMANCGNRHNTEKTVTPNQEQSTTTQDQGKELAPDFTLSDINGKPFTLSSLRGRIVVIDFGAAGAAGA